MEKVKCPVCRSTAVTVTWELYHFEESGLPNVYLHNIEMVTCSSCREKTISIPLALNVMKCIAEGVILKPGSLTGAEIKFLRKNLSLKAAELARLIGVDRVTISRWENGHDVPSAPADRLIRLLYASETGAAQLLERLKARFEQENQTDQNYRVTVHVEPQTCWTQI